MLVSIPMSKMTIILYVFRDSFRTDQFSSLRLSNWFECDKSPSAPAFSVLRVRTEKTSCKRVESLCLRLMSAEAPGIASLLVWFSLNWRRAAKRSSVDASCMRRRRRISRSMLRRRCHGASCSRGGAKDPERRRSFDSFSVCEVVGRRSIRL